MTRNKTKREKMLFRLLKWWFVGETVYTKKYELNYLKKVASCIEYNLDIMEGKYDKSNM